MTQKEVCEFIKTALELVGFKSATIVFRNKISAHGSTVDFIITYRYH